MEPAEKKRRVQDDGTLEKEVCHDNEAVVLERGANSGKENDTPVNTVICAEELALGGNTNTGKESDRVESELVLEKGDGVTCTLQLGARLLVGWDLVDSSQISSEGSLPDQEEHGAANTGGEQREAVWWGCELVRITDKHEFGKPVCVVLYDKHEEYEPEECSCVFLSGTTLWDCKTKTELPFALEEDADANHELLDQLAGKSCLTMVDVLELQHAVDTEQGESSVEAGQAEFAKLPLMQQHVMAITYRTFADKLKLRLTAIRETKGETYEITKQDVDQIMGELRAEMSSAA